MFKYKINLYLDVILKDILLFLNFFYVIKNLFKKIKIVYFQKEIFSFLFFGDYVFIKMFYLNQNMSKKKLKKTFFKIYIYIYTHTKITVDEHSLDVSNSLLVSSSCFKSCDRIALLIRRIPIIPPICP